MNKLQEILRAFPEYWQIGDESVPVMNITYAGTSCRIKIENDQMEIIPSGSKRLCIALDQVIEEPLTHIPFQLTLKELANRLTNATDFPDTFVPNLAISFIESSFRNFSDGTAPPPDLENMWRTYPNIWTNYRLPGGLREAVDTTIPPDGILDTVGWYTNVPGVDRPLMVPGFPTNIEELGAVILTDTNQEVRDNGTFVASTNLLWSLLRPIARVMRNADSYGSDLVSQMDLRTVDGAWLDRWGEIYGIERIYPETDYQYRKRMISTVFRPRLSPTSIEAALLQAFGYFNVTITDTGTAYDFLVEFDATPERAFYFGAPTRKLIDIYRAAGTTYSMTGNLWTPDEFVPKPFQTLRMRKFFPDDTFEGYTTIENGAWHKDIIRVGPVSKETLQEFGGREFGENFFG